MLRQARIVIAGLPYHLTQRGNHRQDVFFTPEDRDVYLRWLQEYRVRFNLSLWTYQIKGSVPFSIGWCDKAKVVMPTYQSY